MVKVKKAALFLCVLVLLLSSAFPAFAESHSYQPYYIKAYNIDIDVTEDNILQITEDIDVYFNTARHGIYRYIPVSNNVARADGTTGRTHAKIRNVKCSDDFSRSYENNDFVMQIGDEDYTITGDHHCTISYDYELGQDIYSGADELYYNIIGSGWDTYIQNVTFNVTMPKEFDENLLGFSTGSYGTAGTSDILYYVNGNEISGSLTKDLAPYEAFTIRLELPEGYFYFNQTAHMMRLCAMVAIPAVCLLFVFVIWHKFGRDKKVEEIVEFYPPEGMSSADVAFWRKGSFVNNDAVGLLIELANEGYLRIKDYENSDYYNGLDRYSIVYVKPYGGDDENKRIFFTGLFENGRKSVTEAQLEDEFYRYLNTITANYNSHSMRTKVFSKYSLLLRAVCWVAVIISFTVNCAVLVGTMGTWDKFAAFALGAVILIITFVLSFFVRKRTEEGFLNLQKIEGFKTFLETAEKERIEELVCDNPEYFYNILPYAYVLGVSDAWIEQFENIAVERPDWYYGGDLTGVRMFNFVENMLLSCESAMVSVPQMSSSGSGGFSSSGGGGGFSGGGSGGGGGGSW